MVKNKFGQMKIQQMIFMLMAVVLFFAMIGVFIIVFKFSSLKDTASLLEEKNALLLASKIANSPEFSCGESFGSNKINCIDMDKFMMLKQRAENYKDFWSVLNIEVIRTYPKISSKIECGLDNYPNCNSIKLRSQNISGYDISNFVSLCHKESNGDYSYDKCEIGKILISYEEK